MKGLYARGKSLNNRYTNNSLKTSINGASKDIDSELARYLQVDKSLAEHISVVKKLIPMKFKDLLKECLRENSNKGNFLRIYPAEGTNIYDKFFKSPRPYNVFLYKCLYTDEILPKSISNSCYSIPASLSPKSNSILVKSDDSKTSQSYVKNSKKSQRPQTVKIGANPSMKSPETAEKII